MIAYSDLVAALRHWRERNGLPNFGTDPGPPPATMVKGPPGPPPAPRAAPPMAPPPQAITVDDEIEAHEIESEEIYENEGNDFALAFGAAGKPAGKGPPPAPAPLPPFGTDPGTNPKFPGGTGYTDPGVTEPEFASGLDDDFVAEQVPTPIAREGTQPGIGIEPAKGRAAIDLDTEDQAVPPEDDAPVAKKSKKKKR